MPRNKQLRSEVYSSKGIAPNGGVVPPKETNPNSLERLKSINDTVFDEKKTTDILNDLSSSNHGSVVTILFLTYLIYNI